MINCYHKEMSQCWARFPLVEKSSILLENIGSMVITEPQVHSNLRVWRKGKGGQYPLIGHAHTARMYGAYNSQINVIELGLDTRLINVNDLMIVKVP